MSRSILIVAQHAPPSALVGARRPAALAKELARRGHRVTILTSLASGRGPIADAQTIRSRDLLSTRLNWRRESLEAMQGARPGSYREASPLQSLVVPDLSIITWLPFLLPRALGAADDLNPDCVITTGPPQSAHLVGLVLRRRGVPWIADLRDGWTFDPPHPPWPNATLAALDARLERSVLQAADRAVAVTEPIAHDLRERLGINAETVTNGFDPDEVPAADGAAGLLDPERFSVVHTGRLIASGDSARTLLEGALELQRRRPDGARRLEVVLAGATSGAQDRLVADPRYADVARPVGVLDRPAALALQRAADALVVLAAGMPGRPSTSVATGKLFEYLAAERPVLVLGEQTEAARIVAHARVGVAAGERDPESVAWALERLVDAPPEPNPQAVRAYAWPALAQRYEALIEEVARGPA